MTERLDGKRFVIMDAASRQGDNTLCLLVDCLIVGVEKEDDNGFDLNNYSHTLLTWLTFSFGKPINLHLFSGFCGAKPCTVFSLFYVLLCILFIW